MLGQIPELFERGSVVLARLDEALNNGWTLSSPSLEGIGRAEAQRSRWTALALWSIVVLLAYALLRHS
jgi:ubiquinone biosynthesis protein